MILRSAPASPFARKVRMIVQHLDLSTRIHIVETNTGQPDEAFLAQNPLGKIPTLILPDGRALYDSAVIAAYLDAMAGGRLVPEGEARWNALTFEALADGIMDAIVLLVYERRWRAQERHEPRWIAHQEAKIARGLSEAMRRINDEDASLHLGHFSLAAGLGYLDLRFDGRWRQSEPGLGSWLDGFAKAVPAFDATRHVDKPA